jgi:hypothetical protein
MGLEDEMEVPGESMTQPAGALQVCMAYPHILLSGDQSN